MSDVAKELEKIILKAGIDGALTEEAVAQFHALVTERNALRSELENEKRVRKEEAEKASRYHTQLAAANTALEEWAGREQDILAAEQEAAVLKKSLAYEQMRVADHKEMMKTVFKPYQLRKSIYENAQEPGHDQYGGTVSTNRSKDVTVKEDEE